jgi:hypothetical protein
VQHGIDNCVNTSIGTIAPGDSKAQEAETGCSK